MICLLYPAVAYGILLLPNWLEGHGVDFDTVFIVSVASVHVLLGALIYRWWAVALPFAFYWTWGFIDCEDLGCVVLFLSGVIGAVSIAVGASLLWLVNNYRSGHFCNCKNAARPS